MQNRNGCGVTIGLIGFVLLAAALFVCSLSIRPVTGQGIALMATADARPPTVGERAESIRQQTRLDNNSMKIPFVIWFFGIGAAGTFLLTKIEALLKAWAELQKLWNRGKKKQMKAPALRIDNPNVWPPPPQAPTRPQLPGSSWPQLPPGGEE